MIAASSAVHPRPCPQLRTELSAFVEQTWLVTIVLNLLWMGRRTALALRRTWSALWLRGLHLHIFKPAALPQLRSYVPSPHAPYYSIEKRLRLPPRTRSVVHFWLYVSSDLG